MERDLDDLDERDDKLGGVMKRRLAQRGREDWENGERAKLVRRIKEKLDEYGGLERFFVMCAAPEAQLLQ